MSEHITSPDVQTLVADQVVTHLDAAREAASFAELAAGIGDYDLMQECIDNAATNIEAAKDMAEVV